MSSWKPILAALVIFTTGFFAGVLFPRPSTPSVAPVVKLTPPALLPDGKRYEAIRRMALDLKLTEEQRRNVETHIRESQERTRAIWELVGPEVQEEFRRLRTDVGRELSPEQHRQFEARLRKARRVEP